MKITATFILAVAAATLIAVCIVQARKAASQKAELAAVKTELAAKAVQAEDAEAAQDQAERQQRRLARKTDEMAAELRTRPAALTNATRAAAGMPGAAAEDSKAGSGKGAMGKALSQMMQDPETRKMIREQQRIMLDQLYAPLVKRMGLSADEANQLKEMLTDNMMNMADKAAGLLGGTGTGNQAGAAGSLAAEQKSFDEQVKAFLGDSRYEQYQQYQETLAQRMQLNAWKLQGGSDYTLSDSQTEELLNIMREEQKKGVESSGLAVGDVDKDPSKLQAILSGGKADQLIQMLEAANQRIYERAQSILSPDQLAGLAQFQTNQLRLTRASFDAMKGMFGAGQTAEASGAGQ